VLVARCRRCERRLQEYGPGDRIQMPGAGSILVPTSRRAFVCHPCKAVAFSAPGRERVIQLAPIIVDMGRDLVRCVRDLARG